MNIHIDTNSLGELFPIFMGVLFGLCIISVILFVVLKNSDNKKPLITNEAKILEKPLQQGNIEWYLVEFTNGERCKLRNLNANRIIISVGDVGIVNYRGKTIESFQRTK